MSRSDRGGWLADRIAGARADADRIARELQERGLLSREEVTRLAEAVDGAVERGRELVVDALREPRRVLAALRPQDAAADAARGAPEAPAEAMRDADVESASSGAAAGARSRDADDARARIDALERRVVALEEALLHARTRRGSEGD